MMAMAQANIENGTIRLGVRADGALMPSVSPEAGITYLPTGNDGLTPGCDCEAWGIADATSNQSGYTGADGGTRNITSTNFTSTATTATSVSEAFGVFEVTHEFAPSASPNLYEVKVTVRNISSNPAELLYGRAMDWDVAPTTFNEYVTLQRGTSTAIVHSSDNGFHRADPLENDPGHNFVNRDVVDDGPSDHGAHFRFNFGTLAPGAIYEFKIAYGAAASEAEAMTALGVFGAEAYSLGKPNRDAAGNPSTDGTPNTFIFAFKGIGGATIVGVDAVDDSPSPIVQPTANVVLTNLLTNDTVNGAPATPADVTLTQEGTWPVGITALPNGDVNVGSTAAPGTYTLVYKICSTVHPTQCDTANLRVQITAAATIVVDAVDDSPTPITKPSTSVVLINLLANDTVNGAPATTATVTLTQQGTWPTGITVLANGDVSVDSTVAPGTYTMSYRICSTTQTTQCDVASLYVQITGPGTGTVQSVPVDHPLALGGLALFMAAFGLRRRRSQRA